MEVALKNKEEYVSIFVDVVGEVPPSPPRMFSCPIWNRALFRTTFCDGRFLCNDCRCAFKYILDQGNQHRVLSSTGAWYSTTKRAQFEFSFLLGKPVKPSIKAPSTEDMLQPQIDNLSSAIDVNCEGRRCRNNVCRS